MTETDGQNTQYVISSQRQAVRIPSVSICRIVVDYYSIVQIEATWRMTIRIETTHLIGICTECKAVMNLIKSEDLITRTKDCLREMLRIVQCT